MADNGFRWQGGFPKIGIRPTIDGRRKGVRESLEDQTMNMAIEVAKLLTDNLRYPNGAPVEVVIADTCIGGVAEAAAAAAPLRRIPARPAPCTTNFESTLVPLLRRTRSIAGVASPAAECARGFPTRNPAGWRPDCPRSECAPDG